MEDSQIIDLYWRRSEEAIEKTAEKYGKYCYRIAYGILQDRLDSEECVNDTYMKAWRAMPPKRPDKLAAFLGKIARSLAIDRWRKYTAKKRGGGQMELVLEELNECIGTQNGPEQAVDEIVLAEILNDFVGALPMQTRKIFVRRYWYMSSVKEIAGDFHFTESKVKMILLRARNELKERLGKEGIVI